MRPALLAVAALVLIPVPAMSSQTVPLKAGDRIRITAVPNAFDHRIARVVNVRHDSLLLNVAGAETLAITLAGVTRLELSTGRRRHTWQGIGVGALIGVSAGAFMGYASGDDRGWCCFTAGAKAAITGGGLGVLGAVVGGVVGSVTVSDRWVLVPLGSAAEAMRLQVGRRRTRGDVAQSFVTHLP